MTDEKSTLRAFVTSKEVTLPSTGKVKILSKLKAGAYYEAQKLYVQWMQDIQGVFAGSAIDISKAVDEKGNPDVKKLEAMAQKAQSAGISSILIKMDATSGKKTELLSICLGEKKEDIEADYYPEDIDVLMKAVIELNNFIENLKNSVAPTLGQGAEKQPKTT
jgi:hypothetical protein